MQITVQKDTIFRQKCAALFLPWIEGKKRPEGVTAAVESSLKGIFSELLNEERFTGAENQVISFRTLGVLPARHIIVVGLGSQKAIHTETIRRASARAIRKAKELGAEQVVAPLFTAGPQVQAREAARAMVEGVVLGQYHFKKFKKETPDSKRRKELQTFTVIVSDTRRIRQIEQGIADGLIAAEGTVLARDLVNEPALHLTPAALADKAEEIAAASGGKITVKRFGKAELQRMGAGGVLSVAMGSDHPPVLVHLIWKPRGARKRIALVGKAITFDSGGLSLKPADGMMTMKCDMGGAASVLGLFSVIAKWNPKVEVHGIFAACENMPSGTAVRPGDVVKTMSGKTIEILNTDAEGRVTLADSLFYATEQKPDHVIDIATLTGACVVALGEEIAGLMTTDARLGDRLKQAAQGAGEQIWELPLPNEYAELVASKIADVKNIGGRWGGALTAGLFLKEFVGDSSWAHLDIAGP
ncbi:MAG: leucyl aminopeptidase, partial [bacterium]|nr:leucyl aminopeptidase [bacterium]